MNGYLETESKPIVMVGRKRQDMISNAISAIENGEYEMPMIRYLYNEFKYASVDDCYGAGHLPDSLAAFSLGDDAARFYRKYGVAKVATQTRW